MNSPPPHISEASLGLLNMSTRSSLMSFVTSCCESLLWASLLRTSCCFRVLEALPKATLYALWP